MIFKNNFLLTTGLLAVSCVSLTAQATPDTGTCTVAPLTVKSLLVEYARGLGDLSSTLQGALPASIVNAVTSGASDVHDRITYDAATNQFIEIVFLVPHGSPSPTPANSPLIAAGQFLYIFVNVDRIMTSCSPYATVSMVGTIREGVPAFGNSKGSQFAFSFGYNINTNNPMRLFRDVIESDFRFRKFLSRLRCRIDCVGIASTRGSVKVSW